MKYISSLLVLFFVFSGGQAQVLPTLPSEPKQQPATQPKTRTAPKPKVIVKNNDRDGDGLSDAIDQ